MIRQKQQQETEADLLYGADGDACSAGDDEVAVLDVWSNLIQNKRDDVGLHSQEEHVALTDRLFVAGRQVHPHSLHTKEKLRTSLHHLPFRLHTTTQDDLTLSPATVGRSVSGELAVILCVAITPGEGHGRKLVKLRLKYLHRGGGGQDDWSAVRSY